MAWSCDKATEALFWVGVSCLLASLLSLLEILSFWLMFFTTWGLSIGICFYLSNLKLSTSRKAVLVTGCDTGIGNAIALHLHDLGFRVFAGCLMADTVSEGVQKLSQIDSSRLHILQLDVTKQAQINDALLEVRRNLPEGEMLWGVVNNAGVSAFGEVEWVPLDTFRKVTEVNVFGLIAVTKAFLPLIRRSQGRVVNMSSVGGHLSRPSLSPYILSKFAVEGFSDCLRKEMAPWGVSVCIIKPSNYSAATHLITDETVERQRMDMWESMDDSVKVDYGRDHFEQVVNLAKLNGCSGLADVGPILQSVFEALTQQHPRARYHPITLYYFLKLLSVTHLPEWLFDLLYESRGVKR